MELNTLNITAIFKNSLDKIKTSPLAPSILNKLFSNKNINKDMIKLDIKQA